MEKQTLKEMFKKAEMGGYAVPAFNYSELWDVLAIIEAAEEEEAPVMFCSIPKVIKAISPEICGAIGLAAMKKATTNAIHHLDHSTEVSLCKAAVDFGYPSVMIDGSLLPLEDNIKAVKEVVEYSHARGVHVEGEIGKIKGRGYEPSSNGDDFLVNVEEAVRLVKETGVDSLAVGIGTAHGFYEGTPVLNFKRLEEINKAIDIPLVLHGGTGIPEADVRRAIKLGINKVNVGTQIRFTFTSAVQEELNKSGPNIHTVDLMEIAKAKVKEAVKIWIRVCMANGKA
jgi:ketose-bisphosphate aldolase